MTRFSLAAAAVVSAALFAAALAAAPANAACNMTLRDIGSSSLPVISPEMIAPKAAAYAAPVVTMMAAGATYEPTPTATVSHSASASMTPIGPSCSIILEDLTTVDLPTVSLATAHAAGFVYETPAAVYDSASVVWMAPNR